MPDTPVREVPNPIPIHPAPESAPQLPPGQPGQLDILFVSMPSRCIEVGIPLAFLMLAGFLDKHTRFTSEILEIKIPMHLDATPQRLQKVEDDMVAEILKRRPRLLGFSLFPGDLPDYLHFGRRIKSLLPDTPQIVGGLLATKDPASLHFAHSPADIVVTGDGEDVLRQLLEGVSFHRIPGTLWMEGDQPKGSGIAIYPHEIDYIPAYHKLDMSYYSQIWTGILRPYYSKGILVVYTLGCPFKCVFCSASQSPVKEKRVETFIEELRILKETYGHNSFLVVDDTFLLRKARRALEFCDAYEASGLDMPWAIQTRSNLIDEELVIRLKRAGCVHMSFGVESGSDRLLRYISKGLTAEKNLAAFELCRRHGIKTFANMMVNLPGEEAEDIELSKAWLKQARPNHVGIAMATPLLGTQMYQENVHPPLTHAEYGIWGSNDAFTRIVDPRFRMAKHDLNLNEVLAEMTLRYHLKTAFGMICFDGWYREKILKTMSKRELAQAFLNRFTIKMRRYIRGIPHLLKQGMGRFTTQVEPPPSH